MLHRSELDSFVNDSFYERRRLVVHERHHRQQIRVSNDRVLHDLGVQMIVFVSFLEVPQVASLVGKIFFAREISDGSAAPNSAGHYQTQMTDSDFLLALLIKQGGIVNVRNRARFAEAAHFAASLFENDSVAGELELRLASVTCLKKTG
jgi:hypothetical protein